MKRCAGTGWISWALRVVPSIAAGTVEFVAYYRSVPGTPAEEHVKGAMHEKSRFEKVHGIWYYLDGEVS